MDLEKKEHSWSSPEYDDTSLDLTGIDIEKLIAPIEAPAKKCIFDFDSDDDTNFQYGNPESDNDLITNTYSIKNLTEMFEAYKKETNLKLRLITEKLDEISKELKKGLEVKHGKVIELQSKIGAPIFRLDDDER